MIGIYLNILVILVGIGIGCFLYGGIKLCY